uniref:ADP-ribosyltransferase exoenzyme n=1 Tax=Iridovirus LCIVAC01 TaxID=2506607 RepID=A0A481YPI9_9VIRU|nr:MAG: ADP-ribosyltransferase exoenzyme [Iridovirus LCIVAC01]
MDKNDALARKVVKESNKVIKEKLTKEEVDLIIDYSEEMFMFFNPYCSVRQDPKEIVKDFEESYRQFEHIFRLAPKLPKMILWRGFSEYQGCDERYKIGNRIFRPSPLSTTYKEDVVFDEDFVVPSDECCILVITIEEGARGLAIESISTRPGEGEILLQFGGELIITGRYKGQRRNEDGVRYTYISAEFKVPKAFKLS